MNIMLVNTKYFYSLQQYKKGNELNTGFVVIFRNSKLYEPSSNLNLWLQSTLLVKTAHKIARIGFANTLTGNFFRDNKTMYAMSALTNAIKKNKYGKIICKFIFYHFFTFLFLLKMSKENENFETYLIFSEAALKEVYVHICIYIKFRIAA